MDKFCSTERETLFNVNGVSCTFAKKHELSLKKEKSGNCRVKSVLMNIPFYTFESFTSTFH